MQKYDDEHINRNMGSSKMIKTDNILHLESAAATKEDHSQNSPPGTSSTNEFMVGADAAKLNHGRSMQKRVYFGIKMRKKSFQDTINSAAHKANLINLTVPIGFYQPRGYNQDSISGAVGGVGHTLLHLPYSIAQSPLLMNALPAGYTPLLHPAKFTKTSSDGFIPSDSMRPLSPHYLAQSQGLQNFDWSRQPSSFSAFDIAKAYKQSFLQTTALTTTEEPDWRDQIYYWVGTLEYDTSLKCLAWKGRWLGSFTGRPTNDEFQQSSNEFFYTSQPIEKSQVTNNDGHLTPMSGFFKGYYMMDNEGRGDLERYDDLEFFVEFEEQIYKSDYVHQYNVFGKGDSEFGVFILYGTFDPATCVLETSRQYLADNDERKTFTMMQLKGYFKAQQQTVPLAD